MPAQTQVRFGGKRKATQMNTKVSIPQNYAQADILMTTNPEGFKSLVVGRVAERAKFEEQEKQFTGDAPFVGILLFRAMQEITRNPTNIAWAGQKPSKALNALFGKPLDKLTVESQCAVAYRLAYAGDTAPEKFDSDEQAAKAETLTRDKYFPESVYLKASAKTLRTLSRIFGRCEEAGNAFRHQAILDACTIIRSPSEKKSKELEDILARLDEKGGYVTSEEKATKDKVDAEAETLKADAMKSELEKVKADAKAEVEKARANSFNLADEADCARMAGTITAANLGAVMSAILAVARTTESKGDAEKLANFAGSLMGVLSARFDKAGIVAAVREAAKGEELAAKAGEKLALK